MNLKLQNNLCGYGKDGKEFFKFSVNTILFLQKTDLLSWKNFVDLDNNLYSRLHIKYARR